MMHTGRKRARSNRCGVKSSLRCRMAVKALDHMINRTTSRNLKTVKGITPFEQLSGIIGNLSKYYLSTCNYWQFYGIIEHSRVEDTTTFG
jgi:hypothetical protein